MKHKRISHGGDKIYAISLEMTPDTLDKFEAYRAALEKRLRRQVSRREAQRYLLDDVEGAKCDKRRDKLEMQFAQR